MSAGFEPGRMVRAVRDTTSAFGRTVHRGDNLTVGRPGQWGEVAPDEFYTEGGGGPFRVVDFEAAETTPAPLDPSKVKAGDTVTLDHPDGTHLPNRTVSSVYAITIGRRQEYLNDLYAEGYTLTAHQPAPEPEPEWKPGAMVQIEGEANKVTATMVRIRDAWVNVDNGLSTEWLPAGPDVRPLVVLDPAEVDVTALVDLLDSAYQDTAGHGYVPHDRNRIALRAVLSALGIEAS